MKVISSGDLAYIPSQVTLINFDKSGTVNKATMTDEPSIVLVTSVNDKGYEIIYGGCQWYVTEKSIYPVDINELKESKNVGNFNRGM
tara:strand:- start:600 stop:860 length:261 start_codon:yes stop_codon:yes gene_type:complete